MIHAGNENEPEKLPLLVVAERTQSNELKIGYEVLVLGPESARPFDALEVTRKAMIENAAQNAAAWSDVASDGAKAGSAAA